MNNKNVYVFLHIPKSAGMTFNRILESNFAENEIGSQVLRKITISDDNERNKLLDYRYFGGHYFLSSIEGILNSIGVKPLLITMFRDPIKQFLSHYNYILLVAKERHFAYKKLRDLSLEDFLKEEETRVWLRNYQTTWLTTDIPFKRFTNYYHEDLDFTKIYLKALSEDRRSDAELFECAKSRLNRFDFVGVTENFNQGIQLLTHTFGWSPVMVYQSENVLREDYILKEFSQESLQILREMFKVDSMVYDYAKGLFDQRYKKMIRTDYPNSNKIANVVLNPSYTMGNKGWHNVEVDVSTGLQWVWTGPELESYLSFILLNINDYMITVRFINSMASDIANSLNIVVNNRSLCLEKSDTNGEIRVSGLLPKEIILESKGRIVMKIGVNRTISPNPVVAESSDNRKLGLAFHSIELRPVQ
ncbi:MAG: sulfotransferase family 2 domain-containing protein [Desulfitobacteriaceae bacterium]